MSDANVRSALTNVTATSHIDDIFSALLALSSGITPIRAVEIINDLPIDDNSDKLGIHFAISALSAKKVMTTIKDATGVNIPDSLTVSGGINFSAFCMIGHIILCVPEANSTDKLKRLRGVFAAKSGGANNILEFGPNGVVPGKEARQNILRQWASTFTGFTPNDSAVIESLAEKFPYLVKKAARGGLFST